MDPLQLGAILAGAVVLASVLSVEPGLSAIVPTAVAQRWFSPDVDAAAAVSADRHGAGAGLPAPEGARP